MKMEDVKAECVQLCPLVFDDSQKASLYVARKIATFIRARNAQGRVTTLGLATGSTPTKVYRELVRMHREEALSFRRVVTFNLDEYHPINHSHPESYHRFMRGHLFDHIDIPDTQINIPDGEISCYEIHSACAKYDAAIADAGGIDIQILGIGRTGHIGFNEPDSSFESDTRMITLDDRTREDAAYRFHGRDNVPRYAITMGVRTIMKARRVFLMAWGDSKAAIVRQAIEEPPTAALPASFLQLHENVCICLDQSSASELHGEQVRPSPKTLFVPDGVSCEEASKRVTHMGIGAHQDDLEIFAFHGIDACFDNADQWFAGVTVTDGGGSARAGMYLDFSDDQMK